MCGQNLLSVETIHRHWSVERSWRTLPGASTLKTPRSPHWPHCLHRKLHVSVMRRTAVTGGGAVSKCRKQLDTRDLLHHFVAERRAYLRIRPPSRPLREVSIAC